MPLKLSEKQLCGMMANAVGEHLRGKLIVPRIYLEPAWPSARERVDVLAIDRSGVGDVYAVEVRSRSNEWRDAAKRLMAIPANYKIVGLPEGPALRERDLNLLYSHSGIGRIGVFRVMQSRKSEIEVQAEIAPQRFKVDESYVTQIDEFTASHSADFEVRY